MNDQILKENLKDKINNFFKKNIKILFLTLITIIIFLIFFSYYNYQKKQNDIIISEQFTNASILIKDNKIKESKLILENILSKDHKFYSPLALNLLIDNEIEKDKKIILNYFDQILKIKSISNENLNLIKIKKALFLLGANIRLVIEDPKNRGARENMLLGSTLAGMAFANSPVAAVHALAYPLGGIYHIPHGLSNALVLSEVLKFNSSNDTAAESYAKLAQIVCPNVNKVRSNRSEAIKFSKYFETLSKTLGLPLKLRELNIPERALKKLAKDAMKQTRLLANNPRPLTEADALKIYQSIW